MKRLTLSLIAEFTKGTLLGNDADIDVVGIDSRNIAKNQLFVAIKGDRFDGHDFIESISENVAGVLVSRRLDSDVPQILVGDTRQALAAMAKAWRQEFTQPVIGLTGSNGKTTLKEMASAILAQRGRVMATFGNLNNDLGVPLTIMRLKAEDDYAVIEMGANHFGEIDFLTHIAKPDVAIVNNAGAAHLEGFGSIKGVSRAKGEIFLGLTKNGIAVVNADDKYADYWFSLNEGREVLSFGMEAEQADVRGVVTDNNQLKISVKDDEVIVNLQLLGKHNAMNALAATAITIALNAPLEQVKAGLESLKPVKGRLAPEPGVNDSLLIDDTYNANPTSTLAAVNVLAGMKGNRILVLGDMGELGDNGDALHADIGIEAKAAGIDSLYCLGDLSQSASKAFGEQGHGFSNIDDLLNDLKEKIEQGTTLLVKGSRSMKMERVVNALSAKEISEAASC